MKKCEDVIVGNYSLADAWVLPAPGIPGQYRVVPLSSSLIHVCHCGESKSHFLVPGSRRLTSQFRRSVCLWESALTQSSISCFCWPSMCFSSLARLFCVCRSAMLAIKASSKVMLDVSLARSSEISPGSNMRRSHIRFTRCPSPAPKSGPEFSYSGVACQ